MRRPSHPYSCAAHFERDCANRFARSIRRALLSMDMIVSIHILARIISSPDTRVNASVSMLALDANNAVL